MKARGSVIALGLALTGVVAVGCDAAVTTPSEREKWDAQLSEDKKEALAIYDELFPDIMEAAGIDEVTEASFYYGWCGGAGPLNDEVQVVVGIAAGDAVPPVDVSAGAVRDLLAEHGWSVENVPRKSIFQAERNGVVLRGETGTGASPAEIEGPCRETSTSYAEEITGQAVVNDLGAPGEAS